MIERHTPIARRLLLSGDPGRHVVHFVSFHVVFCRPVLPRVC
jgi:hypothetical protein